MRKKIVAGNWKMNKTLPEGVGLIEQILKGLKETPVAKPPEELIIVLAPPFILLERACQMVSTIKNVSVAAQNCHQKDSGAFTGEISVPMLKAVGVGYAIIGHSERRSYFKETYSELGAKVDNAIRHQLTPIFCIGEVQEEREKNRHFDIVLEQLEGSLFHLSIDDFSRAVIAYEPVWAIGTGVTATPAQAQEMHAFIRECVRKKYNNEIAENTTILYGGSCNPTNAPELFSMPDVDGGLIGGASLKAGDFLSIIHSI